MSDVIPSNEKSPRQLIEQLVGYVTRTSNQYGFAKALQEIEAALSRAPETGGECNGNCFQVGGPFIAEDPACPTHGSAVKSGADPFSDLPVEST